MGDAKIGSFDDLLELTPDGLLEGTGARMRHVKVRSVEDAKRSSVVALVKRAQEHRRATDAAR